MSGLKSRGKTGGRSSHVQTAHNDPLAESTSLPVIVPGTEGNLASQVAIDSEMMQHANIGTSAISSELAGPASEQQPILGMGRMSRFTNLANAQNKTAAVFDIN